jgi:hypothetical protein
MINDDALIPDRVIADGLGITLRALRDRENKDPDFPPAYRIHGRKYRRQGDVRTYKERARLNTSENAGFQAVQQRPRAISDDGKSTGRFGTANDQQENGGPMRRPAVNLSLHSSALPQQKDRQDVNYLSSAGSTCKP